MIMYLCCLLLLRDIIIFLLLWRDIAYSAESAVKSQENKHYVVGYSACMKQKLLPLV